MSSPTTAHQDYLGSATNGRQPLPGPYISSSYGQSESYSPHTSSASAQQQYHTGQYSGYVNASPTSPFNAHSSDRHAAWQPPMSNHNASRPDSYGHVESSSYRLPSVQRQHSHSHSGSYFPPLGGSPYDSSRAAPAQTYSATSDRYRTSGGNVLASIPYSSNYTYGSSVPPSSGSVAHHPASVPRQPPSPVEVRCEWDRHCRVPLDDTSPAGIARHLRQYHDIPVTDNRTRGVCIWGGRCQKDMFPSSFGKHIAECHLRNMTKQCPHCGADFARADTLSRHIKAFCPHTTGHAGHAGQAYSST